MTTHQNTNQAQRRATTLIGYKVLTTRPQC